jgi:hypothetical protein
MAMAVEVQRALQRYLAAERELEDARWALLDAANAASASERASIREQAHSAHVGDSLAAQGVPRNAMARMQRSLDRSSDA